MPLTPAQTNIIKATVPVLQQHGEAVTSTFYRNLFAAHPELYNIFNPANQHNGGQQRSLAAAVLAYAQHIENPEVLRHMLDRIESKHVTLEVQPAHYPIVGQFLLGAIKETLGDAATDDILDAWAAAYGQLAEIMIGQEAQLYDRAATQAHGWRGFKSFRVARKTAESSVMSSFYLIPQDGSPLPPFEPGQYLSIKVRPSGFPYEQIRQYSLSSAPNSHAYRISVQREFAADGAGAPDGLVSNFLHDNVQEGDLIDVHVPAGDFVLRPGHSPVVLLSGGSGITALLSMLEHLTSPAGGSRQVLFVHAARERARHPFAEHVRSLGAKRPGVKVIVLYEELGPNDREGEHYDAVGRLSASVLRTQDIPPHAQFYYCGPLGFMNAVDNVLNELNVPATNRFSETFAPDPSFTIA